MSFGRALYSPHNMRSRRQGRRATRRCARGARGGRRRERPRVGRVRPLRQPAARAPFHTARVFPSKGDLYSTQRRDAGRNLARRASPASAAHGASSVADARATARSPRKDQRVVCVCASRELSVGDAPRPPEREERESFGVLGLCVFRRGPVFVFFFILLFSPPRAASALFVRAGSSAFSSSTTPRCFRLARLPGRRLEWRRVRGARRLLRGRRARHRALAAQRPTSRVCVRFARALRRGRAASAGERREREFWCFGSLCVSQRPRLRLFLHLALLATSRRVRAVCARGLVRFLVINHSPLFSSRAFARPTSRVEARVARWPLVRRSKIRFSRIFACRAQRSKRIGCARRSSA